MRCRRQEASVVIGLPAACLLVEDPPGRGEGELLTIELDFGLPLVAPFDVELELLRASTGDLYGGPLASESSDCLWPAVDVDGDVEGGFRIARIGDLQREFRTGCRGVFEHTIRRPYHDWPQGRRVGERASATVVLGCLLRVPKGLQGERAGSVTIRVIPGQLGQECLVRVSIVGEEHHRRFVAADSARLEVERSPIGA